MIFTAIGAVITIIGFCLVAFGDEIAAALHATGDIRLDQLIFCGLGILSLLIGLPLLFIGSKKRRACKRLPEDGYSVNGLVTGVEEDYAVVINLKHPQYAICECVHPSMGEKMSCKRQHHGRSDAAGGTVFAGVH